MTISKIDYNDEKLSTFSNVSCIHLLWFANYPLYSNWKITYLDSIQLLQLSSAHVCLIYPFVLR